MSLTRRRYARCLPSCSSTPSTSPGHQGRGHRGQLHVRIPPGEGEAATVAGRVTMMDEILARGIQGHSRLK